MTNYDFTYDYGYNEDYKMSTVYIINLIKGTINVRQFSGKIKNTESIFEIKNTLISNTNKFYSDIDENE